MQLKLWTAASAAALLALGTGSALAQSGSVDQAVGGYSFEDAAKEADGTKNFHSDDGILTFAIVTHTAGNGFFDPVYVGATVAGNMIGAKILLLGSESPTDDPAREIEILNQIVNDPTLDGLIMTTPQVGAYDDIVARGGSERASRSRPPTRSTAASSTATASATPARTRRRPPSPARRWCSAWSTVASPRARSSCPTTPRWATSRSTTASPRPSTRSSAALEANGTLDNFQVDAGPENVGVAADMNDPVNSIISLIESRGDVVGAFAGNNVFTPALARAVAQTGKTGKMCAYGFDLGPAQQEALRSGDLTGALGQQPFLQGFWPVMQLYLQIDRGIAAANLDTRAQLVTERHRRHGRQALRELTRLAAALYSPALRGRLSPAALSLRAARGEA